MIPKSDFQLMDKFFLKSSGKIEIPTLQGKLANALLKIYGIPNDLVDQFVPL